MGAAKVNEVCSSGRTWGVMRRHWIWGSWGCLLSSHRGNSGHVAVGSKVDSWTLSFLARLNLIDGFSSNLVVTVRVKKSRSNLFLRVQPLLL
jgi:uncharacterized metal-binding protein